MGLRKYQLIFGGLLVGLMAGCAASQDPGSCAQAPSQQVAGSTGSSQVFIPDPAMASHNSELTPGGDLDSARSPVTLEHLSGKGVLQGRYVDVRTNEGSCQGAYGAYSADNDFSYSQKDPHFQEAMAYYWGDLYQSALQDAGVEVPSDPIQIVAHCMKEDNAFFQVLFMSDGSRVDQVCLGDSQVTPGASYADDAYVTVHELQHAMTANHYSSTQFLDQFPYDEAGALNEGISDFMAMMFLSSYVPEHFDPAIFSSWALGHFMGEPEYRGARKCPSYDPSFPECLDFPSFGGVDNSISYVYPDGLDWPFSGGPTDVASAFSDFGMPEEIHNNAIIIEGTLWDIYQDMLISHSGDPKPLMMRLVAKTVEDLPKPDSADLSPVNFHEFARSLLHVARAMALSPLDLSSVTGPLEQRGLLHATELEPGWAMQGNGIPSTPGMSVIDNADVLKGWLARRGQSGSFVATPMNTSNGRLNPGETAVIWFDLEDVSYKGISAGGVTLTVTSGDPNVTFVRQPNEGWISSSEVQLQYAKINGTKIVKRLSTPANPRLVTGNSYFQTDPHFQFSMNQGINLMTGVWVQISPNAAHGENVAFRIKAKPANGAASSVTFNAVIK